MDSSGTSTSPFGDFLDWAQMVVLNIVYFGLGMKLGSEVSGLSPLQSFLQLLFLYIWIYFVHWLSHSGWLPMSGPWHPINFHEWVHHSQPKPFSRPIELLLEGISDFFGVASLLLLKHVAGIHVLSSALILYFAFIYASVHIVNQSVFGSPKHREHHMDLHVNLGPDLVDLCMGTRAVDPSQPTENELPQLLNMLGSYGLTRWILKKVRWL